MGLLAILNGRDGYSDDIFAAIQKAANCVKERDEEYFYFIYPDALENEEQFIEYKKVLKEVAKDCDRKLFEIVIPSNQDVFVLLEPIVKLLGIESVEELHLPIVITYDPEQEDGLFSANGVWSCKQSH